MPYTRRTRGAPAPHAIHQRDVWSLALPHPPWMRRSLQELEKWKLIGKTSMSDHDLERWTNSSRKHAQKTRAGGDEETALARGKVLRHPTPNPNPTLVFTLTLTLTLTLGAAPAVRADRGRRRGGPGAPRRGWAAVRARGHGAGAAAAARTVRAARVAARHRHRAGIARRGLGAAGRPLAQPRAVVAPGQTHRGDAGQPGAAATAATATATAIRRRAACRRAHHARRACSGAAGSGATGSSATGAGGGGGVCCEAGRCRRPFEPGPEHARRQRFELAPKQRRLRERRGAGVQQLKQ